MFAAERQLKIINYVNMYKNIRVSHLSRLCSVSEETIRRDLKKLEKENRLIRQHGSAISKEKSSSSYLTPDIECRDEDKYVKLALKAIQFIKKNDRIVLDDSKEAYYIAKYLPEITLTVVTTSVKILLILLERKNITIMAVGGELQRKTLSYRGSLSEQVFNTLYFDKAFISCDGLDTRNGLTVGCESDARLKREIVHNVNKVYVLLQANRINKIMSSRICAIEEVYAVITNFEVDEVMKKEMINTTVINID